jgi:hypothetical protein
MQNRFANLLRLLVVAAVILSIEGTGWSQCAMCRTALANSPEGQAVAEGFRSGIIFLLAAPYAIIGSIAVGVLRAFRRKGGTAGR